MKHTKGEWTFSPMKGTKHHCFSAQVWDENGFNLASIDSRYGEIEATANAKLIAEAGTVANETGKTPRQLADENKILLEAAKEAISSIDSLMFEHNDYGPGYLISLNQIKKAIRKATE